MAEPEPTSGVQITAEDFRQLQEQLNELRNRNQELEGELKRKNAAPNVASEPGSGQPKFPVKILPKPAGRRVVVEEEVVEPSASASSELAQEPAQPRETRKSDFKPRSYQSRRPEPSVVAHSPWETGSPQRHRRDAREIRDVNRRIDSVEMREMKRRKVAVERPNVDGDEWEDGNSEFSTPRSENRAITKNLLRRVKVEPWADEEEQYSTVDVDGMDSFLDAPTPYRRVVNPSPTKSGVGWWDRVSKLRTSIEIEEFIRLTGGPPAGVDFRTFASKGRFPPQSLSLGIEVSMKLNQHYRRLLHSQRNEISETRSEMSSVRRRLLELERRTDTSKPFPFSSSHNIDIVQFCYINMTYAGLPRDEFWIEPSGESKFRRCNFLDLYEQMERKRPANAVTEHALNRRFKQETRILCRELIHSVCADMPADCLLKINIRKINNLNSIVALSGRSDADGVSDSANEGNEMLDDSASKLRANKRLTKKERETAYLWLNQRIHALFLKHVINCICSDTDADMEIPTQLYVHFVENILYDVCRKFRNQASIGGDYAAYDPADINLS